MLDVYKLDKVYFVVIMKILVKRLKLFYKELIKGKMKCLKHSIRKLEKESFLYL